MFHLLKGDSEFSKASACLYIGAATVLRNMLVNLNDLNFEWEYNDLNEEHLIFPDNELQQKTEIVLL